MLFSSAQCPTALGHSLLHNGYSELFPCGLSNGSVNKHVLTRTMAQQDRNGVFCAVRAEMLSTGQLESVELSWLVSE
jgi:hypothetical protein